MAETTRLNDVNLEDCRLVFKNLSGNEGKFNAAGNRNFCVLLSPEEGKALREEGWNVKELKPREEGDLPQGYLKVKVNYKSAVLRRYIWSQPMARRSLMRVTSILLTGQTSRWLT